jgi:MurNAc alpha-1-phosphate uridylyltransferase
MPTHRDAPAAVTSGGGLDRPPLHANLSAMLLAAGHGTRLAPLTDLAPKPLCPVGNAPMIDLALRHASGQTDRTIVNVHRFRDQFEQWCPNGVDLSFEKELLGTAGGVANIASWVGDDDLLVINSDALLIGDIGPFVSGWNRATIRLLVTPDPGRPDFEGIWRFAGVSLMPNRTVHDLAQGFSDLYRAAWLPAQQACLLELVPFAGSHIDCGTLADYLFANLTVAGQRAVVAPDAVVRGEVIDSVVWSGCEVGPGERLVRSVRARNDVTVEIPPRP